MYQGEPERLIFTCVCSFKRPEERGVDVQETCNLREKYRLALGSKKPQDWPEAPTIDSPWYVLNLRVSFDLLTVCSRFWKWRTEPGKSRDGDSNSHFPGATRRKVDMRPYNETVEPKDRIQLQYYNILGPLPPVEEEPNLHAAAHVYVSDSNGLFILPNFLQEENADNYHAIGSLHHSMVFHTEPEDISWYDKDGNPRYFCQEAWIGRFAYGRGLTPSKYWNEDGVHVISTFQDGMMRFGPGKKQLESSAMFTSYQRSKSKDKSDKESKL